MNSQSQTQDSNRNFDFVPLPAQKPWKVDPQPAQGDKKFGHDQYQLNNRFSGKLFLRLTTQAPVSVNSGIVEMGRNLAKESSNPTISNQVKSIPLIKSSVRKDGKLIIPGSSLKGVVRSMYEAITRSCICKTKADISREYRECQMPSGYPDCHDPSWLCPACLLFGAMNWQGLVHFTDAEYQADGFQTRKIPPLFSPKPKAVDLAGRKVYFSDRDQTLIRGRKFYPHTYEGSAEPKLQVQHAEVGQSFTTLLRYVNLTSEQLGALFIVLGLEQEKPLALKIGGGKGVGMGSIGVKATGIEELNSDYYLSFTASHHWIEDKELDTFIQSKIKAVFPQTTNQATNQETSSNGRLKPKPKPINQLVQSEQLIKLKSILQILPPSNDVAGR